METRGLIAEISRPITTHNIYCECLGYHEGVWYIITLVQQQSSKTHSTTYSSTPAWVCNATRLFVRVVGSKNLSSCNCAPALLYAL